MPIGAHKLFIIKKCIGDEKDIVIDGVNTWGTAIR